MEPEPAPRPHDQPEPTRAGRVVLVATPIGNLGDLSPRAADALRDADVVAAEDTRRTRRLLDGIGAATPTISSHEHNEEGRAGPLLDRVAAGEVVAVVTDAGTPGLSDPGFAIARAAIARGLDVAAVPGPSAALCALVLSGLPMDRFAFEGFLPRKSAARRARLGELAADRRTLVFYVSPHRAADDLAAMSEAFGPDRPAAVARELTKLHEEVRRGPIGELAASVADGIRGEVTVCVGGAPEQLAGTVAPGELAARVRALVATGVDRKVATKQVAEAAGVPKREVYQAVLDTGGE